MLEGGFARWLLAAAMATAGLAVGAQPEETSHKVPRFDPPSAAQDGGPSEEFISFRDPAKLMQLGGYLMWPILFCSFLTILFAVERVISLRRSRIVPHRFLRELWTELEGGRLRRDQAVWQCRANGSPAAMIVLSALRLWGRPMVEIEQAINDAGEREMPVLRRNLRGLQATANLAMLLGLLGTVIGMILAFNEVGIARGQPRGEMLAFGIAQALLTTAFGLFVAIPALFLHGYFAGRVERLVYELDQAALSFAERICAEAQGQKFQEAPPPVAEAPVRLADTKPAPPESKPPAAPRRKQSGR